jgi:phosphoribosylformylglycinamidine synthase
MKTAVIIYPGSNCDRDCIDVMRRLMDWEVVEAWHRDQLPFGLDLVVIPGGFSFGDYLRTGALAALSPVMRSLRQYAEAGGLVVGICNGFQILCEAGLLPGTLRRNHKLQFRCEEVLVRVERDDTAFTWRCPPRLRLPIAHGEGAYWCDEETHRELVANRQILFRYADRHGEATERANPNGSIDNIAGITNLEGNVLGMMPHPERAAEAILGSDHGLHIFNSLNEEMMSAMSTRR